MVEASCALLHRPPSSLPVTIIAIVARNHSNVVCNVIKLSDVIIDTIAILACNQ